MASDALHARIDALDEARTVADLAARLKPILNALAYSAAMGEGAVLDVHEDWHNTFEDRLYEATSEDSHAASQKAAQKAAQKTAQKAAQKTAQKVAQKAAEAQKAAVQRAEAARPPRGAVPASLMAIMNGTHPSLREEQ